MTERSGADPIRHIVIVGGGTAGWSAAAGLAAFARNGQFSITLIESEQIGIIGVGEATVPHFRAFNQNVGIEEVDFIRSTNATYKLGIEFVNWARLGDRYFHPFGETRRRIGGVEPHQHQMRLEAEGIDYDRSWTSVATVAAMQNRFAMPEPANPRNFIEPHTFAFHFDATLYAPLLRRHAEQGGAVQRIEGMVTDVTLRGNDGFIESVTLSDGRVIEGDLFLDCSGFRSLLLGNSLGVKDIDWSHWLPCNRAIAAPCEGVTPLLPYTRSTSRGSGWQWRIPLQQRIGNGYIYCSEFCDDDAARNEFEEAVEAPLLAEPRVIPFKTGHREKLWHKNCIAIGLSGGFLEPLESTSIYFLHRSVLQLIDLFPTRACEPELANEFNRILIDEFEQTRDFLVAHYTMTERDDTPFWRHCRAISKPDSLETKLELFRRRGIVNPSRSFYRDISWTAVLLGQRLRPQGWTPLLDRIPIDAATAALLEEAQSVKDHVTQMPTHDDFLAGVLANG